ncbi:MAG: FtsW/RodA/SpoVE family cell cycle protein [Clostridia bacterium]|nr:FtsW/RodA/SpoVE family cell cycle protein [Clostridia bacterium]
MIDLFIIISKYLFIIYIAVFVFCGFMINLKRQNMAGFNIAAGLSNQRICIILFHITASVVLISAAYEYDIQPVIIYCVIGFLLIIGGNTITAKLYPEGSHLLYNCVFFLMDIGLMMLYRLNTDLAVKQLIWNTIGIAMMIVMPKILSVMPELYRFRKVYIICAFALLFATLVFGFASGGSKNWIDIGPIGFQPSEIIKVFFVFYLASAFAEKPTFKKLIIPTVLSGIIVLVLVGGQNDLGSALIFYMTFVVLLFIATSNYFYLLGGLAFISVAAGAAYKLFSHIRVRVEAWQNPWLDPGDTGYQIAHSLFAICTWGVTGIGFTRGYATSIPVVERDLIFSAVCEEFGVIFAIGLILIFMLILLEGARGAIENNNRFLSLVCAGFNALIAFQSFLIIGGVIKFIPLTGVTLPFVSYGGTSIVISYIIVAIMQWIIMKNQEYERDKKAEDIHERIRHPQTRKAMKMTEGAYDNGEKTSKRKVKTQGSSISGAKKYDLNIRSNSEGAVERPARRNVKSAKKTPPDIGGRPESYNRKRRDH